MDILDMRLNDNGKHWRRIIKSLKVLTYCLHKGSEYFITWTRKNIYVIKRLYDFQYTDEDDGDVGQRSKRVSRIEQHQMWKFS
jgi:ENTH domain